MVKDLEEKLLSLEALDLKENHTEGREIRVWMDGAFDMMHYGHMNAFRQGRALGTTLIVGVNSDETITQCKGAPIMNDDVSHSKSILDPFLCPLGTHGDGPIM